MRNFRNYDVWIDGMTLVNIIYNIVEGASRNSEKDFGRFLEISLGATFELET